ncbi:MAG: proton-conducting transporter membrane subunit [Planctomycetota bacterium]|nr:proton-conducting transporter membrane subunit [Planctomycetota bacterium]
MIPLEMLALALPLFGAVLPWLLRRQHTLRNCGTLLLSVALLLTVIQLLPAVLQGQSSTVVFGSIAPGLDFMLEIDALGLIFALVASSLWILNSIYSVGYMHGLYGANFEGQERYWSCFALAILAAMGIAFSGNLLTLFLFYELMTFSTWPLITHHRSAAAKRSGRIYLAILVGSSTLLLLTAIVWTWVLTGTVRFEAGGILAGSASPTQISLLILLFFFGTAKTAIFPFHQWLPNAMVAPTPVSALLHAVAVVKAGVFTVLKLSTSIIGPTAMQQSWGAEVVAWFAAGTILLTSVIALSRPELKARLAYSTIGQLNYIVLGAAVAFPAALQGGALHIAMHAYGKITLFFAAGAIYVASRKTRVDQLDGIGHRMPWTMTAFLIGSLSTLGLPPLAGTWSKWLLCVGMIEAHQWAFLATLLISTLLGLGYLLPIPIRAFFAKESTAAAVKGYEDHGEAPWACRIPLLVSALACLVLFFWPGIYDQLAQMIEGSQP